MKLFSHIYIEEDARDLPETKSLLQKFSRATLIPIHHYKEVFNRPRQDFRSQKSIQNLILAVRRDDFYYPGSSFTPSCGSAHFYYNSLVLNCLYDCDYCYLQGLFPGAHMVMFMNNRDYMSATERLLSEKSPIYLCISYDTDLLAIEHFYPYVREWIEFAEDRPDLTLEVRTKSANYELISDIPPVSNVLLAWTLSPRVIAAAHESRAAGLDARLSSIRAALTAGWRVRICIDPVLRVPEWRRIYGEFLDRLLPELQRAPRAELNLGFFRMNHKYLRRIQETRREPALLHYPFARRGGSSAYSPAEIDEMRSFFSDRCAEYLPGSQVLWSPGSEC